VPQDGKEDDEALDETLLGSSSLGQFFPQMGQFLPQMGQFLPQMGRLHLRFHLDGSTLTTQQPSPFLPDVGRLFILQKESRIRHGSHNLSVRAQG